MHITRKQQAVDKIQGRIQRLCEPLARPMILKFANSFTIASNGNLWRTARGQRYSF